MVSSPKGMHANSLSSWYPTASVISMFVETNEAHRLISTILAYMPLAIPKQNSQTFLSSVHQQKSNIVKTLYSYLRQRSTAHDFLESSLTILKDQVGGLRADLTRITIRDLGLAEKSAHYKTVKESAKEKGAMVPDAEFLGKIEDVPIYTLATRRLYGELLRLVIASHGHLQSLTPPGGDKEDPFVIFTKTFLMDLLRDM